MSLSGRRRRKKSCSVLRRKARRIQNKRKRKAALRRLPKRCKNRQVQPRPGGTTIPGGTQPTVPQQPGGSGTPTPTNPDSAPSGPIDSPIPVYSGTFGPREAERLLWRAGFGPRPGQADQLAQLGLEEAVASLTRASGTPVMDGAGPHDQDGAGLDPYANWGHDHLWWMDRMVRSRHQLVERMALVWHDWFATSDAGVGSRTFMLEQNNLFRTAGLGNFKQLLRAVTTDKAMLVWLSGLDNRRNSINENYARELMELFTLGADRGAYTETDVREMARALSGFRAEWADGVGLYDFRFDVNRHDGGSKTIFGQTGAFGWEDACRLVTDHPLHPSFFVAKLWSYFIPEPPDAATAAALEARYVASGYEVRPIVEAILCARELYEGPRMIKPPIVFNVGLLRATGQTITSDVWTWMGSQAGQRLFFPPDVSGWNDRNWLDTNTMSGRWAVANHALTPGSIQPTGSYPAETAAQALNAARASLNDPPLTAETNQALDAFAADIVPAVPNGWERAQRYNALRQIIAMSPDYQTS